jgi:cytochrome c oxidase subunit 3
VTEHVIQEKDTQGSIFGMWLFLYTEIMLFGGLFILYASYYYGYMEEFHTAARGMDVTIGTVNTVILLISSFFVASAVTALKRMSRSLALFFLSFAPILGIIFLVNKYFEWSHKFHAGIIPGSAELVGGSKGETVYYSLYFMLTGVHALHVLIGIFVLILCLILISRAKEKEPPVIFVENSGLFWHLVDIIWIFLFPLFYLIL